MFGLGPTELIVILVLALLVLGPSRIPDVASSLGKAIRSFRRATRELRDQIDIDDEVRRPLEDLRAALRDEPAPLPPPSPAPHLPIISPPADPIHSTAPEHETPAAAAAHPGADSAHPPIAEAVHHAVDPSQPIPLHGNASPDAGTGLGRPAPPSSSEAAK